jgi:hypothetical protein
MCRNAGGANARLAVFAGTTSSDFLFIAYPDKFYEFVFWAKRLIG